MQCNFDTVHSEINKHTSALQPWVSIYTRRDRKWGNGKRGNCTWKILWQLSWYTYYTSMLHADQVSTVPPTCRISHLCKYRAISVFLKVHQWNNNNYDYITIHTEGESVSLTAGRNNNGGASSNFLNLHTKTFFRTGCFELLLNESGQLEALQVSIVLSCCASACPVV